MKFDLISCTANFLLPAIHPAWHICCHINASWSLPWIRTVMHWWTGLSSLVFAEQYWLLAPVYIISPFLRNHTQPLTTSCNEVLPWL
jgi:hypothetical protein